LAEKGGDGMDAIGERNPALNWSCGFYKKLFVNTIKIDKSTSNNTSNANNSGRKSFLKLG